ncbi:NAD-dependent dehydratase [bacterium (Candidatus Blackallbacteria) CG17_big_fil_post_rev_8_21_14_2_50_48_46]|uniref:NAD-dependent dehydratase n=1 Tax=bacterium (Candidatus Blackallbacteria) CG17_big_fil_post_rev_8_21_14_2_50_48_46 TaxID=2014261 RepID=A0A2M7G773_9BACT|nr:MAG: NAD-dependent dehydratase [bacterium (Candidatus Blackallbacteria) CG18_big_fil_WC_8_21_14_2_50_49_26]PIW17847.1 MAG: NAD-dependent dehydratase [bacterium (Candidatus Blackallbacteria) CG17_big_fil_post_rev_8_21_14_2_50_48_46]PIW48523.1 MAG: NAD-dependent dehydratase [bacterium (Candidatus Blackallbacteria) CG13_big_fil_rev_8_21_14_2_50_49_14]
MKTALIMGITGHFGKAVALELQSRGWHLKALLRPETSAKAEVCQSLSQEFPTLEIISGQASQLEDVHRAAEQVELIVYGVNPPGYDWKNKALPWLEQAARVAEEKQLTLLFPGNVYVFNPEQGPCFDENAQIQPITSKGQIRQQMEARLQSAAEKGAQVIVIRAGNFIPAGKGFSWLQLLIKTSAKKRVLNFPGPEQTRQAWAYLPDLAKVAAELVERADELKGYQVFHFEGHTLNFAELSQSLQAITSQPLVCKNFFWLPFQFLKPFSPLFQGVLEMRYLWQKEVLLDQSKLLRFLGHQPEQTPLQQILSELLA